MRFHAVVVTLVGLASIARPAPALESLPAVVAFDSFGPEDRTQPGGVWMGSDLDPHRYFLIGQPFRLSTPGRLASVTTSIFMYHGNVNRITLRITGDHPTRGVPDRTNVIWSQTFNGALSYAGGQERSTFRASDGPALAADTTYWMFPEVPREGTRPYAWWFVEPGTPTPLAGYARYVEQSGLPTTLTFERTGADLGMRIVVLAPEPSAVLPLALVLALTRRRRTGAR